MSVVVPEKVLRWMEERMRMPRRLAYVVIGCLLGLGAPSGLVLMRAMSADRVGATWLWDELGRNLDVYLYLSITTCAVFMLLGRLVGAQTDELRRASMSDPLTGLWNRRYFNQRLSHEIDRAARYRHPLSLLLIDVDYLKQINDQHGHRGGDVALLAVGESLRRTCRRADLPVRFAGDEFAVLAPSTSALEARRLAERIQAALREAPQPREAQLKPVTVSIGIADLLADKENGATGLVEAADRALYDAKAAGRNRAAIANRNVSEAWAAPTRDEPTVKLRTRAPQQS